MATPDTLASEIMNKSAALLNDTQKQVYTFSAQLPYLQMALLELREMLEESNVPVTQKTSIFITVLANTSIIGFNTIPALPQDLIEIQQLWERPQGIDPYIPVQRVDYLPHYLDGVQISNFLIWTWINNEIHVLPTNQNNDLKIDYIAQLNEIVDENTNIGIINGQTFLEYRNAALCAEFIGANPSRSESLNVMAIMARDRLININNKGKQAIVFRKRPFRYSYKYRGGPW